MREQKKLLEQFKNAQHIAKLGSWEQDTNDEILFCSNEIYNILELDHQGTMTFEQFLDRVHPDDRNKLTISFQSSIEEHTSYHLEHRLLFSDGRVKYIIEHAEHSYDKNNKHIGTIGTLQDVTERMQYEKALEEKNILLEEHEQKLLQAQEIAKIGNWTLDVKTMTADWSDEMRQICDIDAHVSVGPEFLSKTVIPEDWPQLQASLMAAAHDGTPHNIEYRIKRQKDGEIRWVDCRAIRVNDKNGDPKLVGTFQDITEKIYTEKEIKNRDMLLTSVFQVIPDLLFIMEKDGTIIDYRAQKNNDLYVNPELFLGKCMQNILPQDIGELFSKNLESLKEDFTFNIFKYELEMEGEKRHYEARMALLPIDNHVMSIVRDISEQVAYEQKLLFQSQLLQQKKQELESIIKDAPNPMMLHNEDGIVLMINQAWIDSSGYSQEELPNIDAWLNCVYDDIEIRAKTKAHIYSLYNISEKDNEGEFTFLNKNREEITWKFSSAPLGIIDGKRTIISSAMDITERKTSEEKLEIAASVFHNTSEAIMITEADGTIYSVNDAFEIVTGYSREEAVGQKESILHSDQNDDMFYQNMLSTLTQTGKWSGEVLNRRRNGELYVENLIINTINNKDGLAKYYISLFSDITVLTEHIKTLEHNVRYDILTGLPNRVLLSDRLTLSMIQAKRHNLSVAVIFLDLDGFKEINDAYGHEVGDQFLTKIGTVMKETLRDGDTLARIGGDEFVVVLPDLHQIKESQAIVNRLLDAASQKIRINDLEMQISASLGITFYPQEKPVDADQLLRQADQAMYEAKLSGKNSYYIFNAKHNELLRERYEMISRIELALEKEEFVLQYQPKVNMSTGEVIGVEALIRWEHPQKGLLYPMNFLPEIENHELSIKIGEWVTHTALKQIVKWQKSELHLPVSINISAYHLLDKNFVERVQSTLLQYPEVKPSSLEMEILETSKLEDLKSAIAVINRCKALGIMFALDDFGTGYSSLTYLQRLPIETIKIDQSFIRNMLHDPNALGILKGILNLSDTFQHPMIAEGIETLEHGIILLQLGCEFGQGYAIAKAMYGKDIPEWVKTWAPHATWKNQALITHAQRQFLFSTLQHRSWIAYLNSYVKDEVHIIENMNFKECVFGKWLEDDGKDYFKSTRSYQDVTALHEDIHTLASQLFQLKSEGKEDEALKKLDALNTLSNNLQELCKIHL